jgi:hypothetical protein
MVTEFEFEKLIDSEKVQATILVSEELRNAVEG